MQRVVLKFDRILIRTKKEPSIIRITAETSRKIMTFIMSFQSVPHPHLVVSRKLEKEQKASKTSQQFRASNDPLKSDDTIRRYARKSTEKIWILLRATQTTPWHRNTFLLYATRSPLKCVLSLDFPLKIFSSRAGRTSSPLTITALLFERDSDTLQTIAFD